MTAASDATTAPSGAVEPSRRVRVEPGLVPVVALLAGCGWSLHGLAVGQAGVTTSAWAYVTVFTAALLVMVAVHETAHVAAARCFGHRFVSVRLGLKFGVVMLGEHTRKTTALTAAAGPAVGALTALLVLSIATPWSPLWAAAGVALVQDVGNVVLFFLPGSDGSKLVAAMRRPQTHAEPIALFPPAETREVA